MKKSLLINSIFVFFLCSCSTIYPDDYFASANQSEIKEIKIRANEKSCGLVFIRYEFELCENNYIDLNIPSEVNIISPSESKKMPVDCIGGANAHLVTDSPFELDLYIKTISHLDSNFKVNIILGDVKDNAFTKKIDVFYMNNFSTYQKMSNFTYKIIN